VELGGNDGLRGIDPRNTEANLAAILDALAARGIPVLLSGMLAPPNLGQDYGDAFRDAFRRLGARPGVMFDPFFLAGVAGDPALNQPDRIHPNARGTAMVAARLVPLVAELLQRVGR
jgi:acyl-CoA thioesterase I